jgi:outer membrane autotransporter protein
LANGAGHYAVDTKGQVGQLDAGYRLKLGKATALTLSGMLDYDGTSCGDGCLLAGATESISEWSAKVGLRFDTSLFSDNFRPFLGVSVSDDLGDGSSVTLMGATARSDAGSMVLDADFGFDALVGGGSSVFLNGRVTEGLDSDVDGYQAMGGVRVSF